MCTFKHITYAYSHIHTSQMKMNICGFFFGLSSAIAVITDIGWAAGDMMHSLLAHHPFVVGGLTLSLTLAVASFYWLMESLEKDYNEFMKAEKHRQEQTHHVTTHCGVKPYVNKYWLNKDGENED